MWNMVLGASAPNADKFISQLSFSAIFENIANYFIELRDEVLDLIEEFYKLNRPFDT